MDEQKIQFADHEGKAGWGQWGYLAYPSLRTGNRFIQDPFLSRERAADRHGNAVQQKEQWGALGFLATHERKTRLDFFGCFEQGKVRTSRTRPDRANGTGAVTEPSKLVWLNMACIGQYQGAGNIPPGLAQGSLCTMEAGRREEGKTNSTIKEKNYIVLSDYRINRTRHISVHRTNGKGCISVHRTYRGYFSRFPISVHRTPSSITTPYRKNWMQRNRRGKP